MRAPLLSPVSMACGEQVDTSGLSSTGVEGGARAPYVRLESRGRSAKDTLIWACKHIADGVGRRAFTCEEFSWITGMNSPLKFKDISI